MSKQKPLSLAELTPDRQNANKGTERGATMIADSLAQLGAGRSILLDGDNEIIAGNKTTKQALAQGFRLKVVDIAPDEILAARRSDLDLDSTTDDRARMMAYLDNMAAFADLAWDAQQVHADAQRLDLTPVFDQAEFDDLARQFQRLQPALQLPTEQPQDGPSALPEAPSATEAPQPNPSSSADPSVAENGADVPSEASYIRMVQLFLSGDQYDEFMAIVERIKDSGVGITNTTDAILYAMRHTDSEL